MLPRWPGLAAAAAAGLVRVAAAALLLAAGSLAAVAGEVPVPELADRVTDLTGTLTQAQRKSLEATLAGLETRRGSQIAVLMLPSTRPETIEQYSIRVAEAWKIGRARVDDGVILVIAKDDHKLRIEVGRGLEGVIPDAIASRVIREVIAPYFVNGDFYGGIAGAIAALARLIDGEPLPPPAARAAGSAPNHGLEGLLFPLIAATVFLGAVLARLLGRMTGAAVTGGIIGFVTWVITSALLAAAFAAIAAFFASLVLGLSGLRTGGVGRGGWSGGGGGYTGGGGGFSGGGGSFGGGGASGSW